jgi:sialate O-acetylesterase
MFRFRYSARIAGLLFLATAALVRGDVKLPTIFGDHMVLQQGARLPVWGAADPGERVTVSVGALTGTTTTNASSKWRIDLPALPYRGAPVTVSVTGKNKIVLHDVLVGDVWIASGQSNMEFNLANELHGAEAIAQANQPQIRLFLVPKKTSLETLTDIAPGEGGLGRWEVCTPEILGGVWSNGWASYSAVAYYFGREVHAFTGRPVGLINTSFGGSPAQAWTSISGLEKDPPFTSEVETFQGLVANFHQATADYPSKMTAYQAALATWEAHGGKAYENEIKSWDAASRHAALSGQVRPSKPVEPPGRPSMPLQPDGGWTSPVTLYNGMIAPLIPFAFKGVIWYQGENNVGAAGEYVTLFPRMIADWREKWGAGDFPFLFVQLASVNVGPVQNWPYLREAQAKALALPQTGMVTAFDIGDPMSVHPVDKLDVGLRLAHLAQRMVYGARIVATGPEFAGVQIEGNKVRLHFSDQGSGLVISRAPWIAPGATPPPTDRLVGFSVAGANRTWLPADAQIDGDTVVVSSANVRAPVAVRYDWGSSIVGNLYNKEGLPAFPFRTDNWPQAPLPGPLTH